MSVHPPANNPDSPLNILAYMKHNIPVCVLLVLTALNKYAFTDMECTGGNKALVIVSYVWLTTCDLVWTVFHCRADYRHNYPAKYNNWHIYAMVRCGTSVLSMYSLTYYIHDGDPFNCFITYNRVTAEVLFYLSFLTIFIVSYLEHMYWKKLDSDDLTQSF